MRVLLHAKMLKETETEKTIDFLLLMAFQLGGFVPPAPPTGYAYGRGIQHVARGPPAAHQRFRSGPRYISNLGWLIDNNALTRYCELQMRVLTPLNPSVLVC